MEITGYIGKVYEHIVSTKKRIFTRFDHWFTGFFIKWITSLSGHPGAWQERILLPKFHFLYTTEKDFIKMYEFRVFRLISQENQPDIPHEVVYISAKADYANLGRQFFNNAPYRAQEIERIPRKNLNAEIEKLAENADFLAATRSEHSHWVPSYGKWLTFPSVLYLIRDFQPGETWEQIERDLKKKNSSNIRKVIKAGFRLETSHSKDDLEFFLYRMHKPYMASRHGERAEIASLENLNEVFESSELRFIITPEGERVAGGLI